MTKAKVTLQQILDTMDSNDFAYQKAIDDFGQVEAFIQRKKGKTFSLQEHVRGLILAQLSNQRPWGPIAQNMEELTKVFHNFEPEILKAANAARLAEDVKKLKCGNRQIAKQCEYLSSNIQQLESIAEEYASIDAFITSKKPELIAKTLSEPGPMKLKQMGFTLSMEYLRNVGINVIKPDLHICRIIGPERLALTDTVPTPEHAYQVLMKWAVETEKSAIWLDNILWLFAAQDYASICTATPSCMNCLVAHCKNKAR